MLEERRVRELLDPLHHQLLQQQHQLHREQRDRERDRDRDHHHHPHHRERDRDHRERHHHHLREQQQSLHHHHQQQLQQLEQQLLQSQHQLQQQVQQHQQQQRERERERDHHRERDREREREHRQQQRHHEQEYRHHSQQLQDHQVKSQHERERDRERDTRGDRSAGGGGGGGGSLESRKQFECGGALPKGWVREEIVRKTGLSAGKIDVCYHSPNGKKFWSKPQLSRFLGDSVDLSTFDFRTGKVNNLLLRKNKKHRPQNDYSRGSRNDTSLLPPIRQTASIFKQPVTVHKTQKLSTVKVDFKHGHQEKPKQLFWEKRLEGLRSCDTSGNPLDTLDLPKGVEPVGPNIRADTVLQSVATALHVNGLPITGQTMPRPNLETNPGVFINPEQPLIQAINVRDDDISRQEEKVLAARKKLEDALKAYDLS